MWPKLIAAFFAGIVTMLVVLGVTVYVLTAPMRSETAQTATGESQTKSPQNTSTSQAAALAAGASVLDTIEFSADELLAPEANVRDVHATADAVTVKDELATAQSLTVDGLVPFALVEEYVGEGISVEHVSGDEVKVSREAEVLGFTVPLAAQGRVFVDGGNIAVEPTAINLGGPGWLQRSAGSLVEKLVTISQPVQGLPDGLRLDSVNAASEGFEVSLSGENVELILSS